MTVEGLKPAFLSVRVRSCARVWEHSVLLFLSRSDVGLFLAVLSQELLAGFNCLFSFLYSTCVHVRLSACHSRCLCHSLFLPDRLW